MTAKSSVNSRTRMNCKMMSKLVSKFCVLGACVFIVGCGGKSYDGDQRFPLSGTASYDGQPIDLGSIALIPNGGTPKATASGGVINDGKYSIPEEKGPNAGSYRVEIHWLKLTGKQLLDQDTGEMYDQRIEALPDKFHANSELNIDVPSPKSTHDFDLKSS